MSSAGSSAALFFNEIFFNRLDLSKVGGDPDWPEGDTKGEPTDTTSEIGSAADGGWLLPEHRGSCAM